VDERLGFGMAGKIKIVHIIDSFGRGGAETLLVNLLKDLNEAYELTLVTLFPQNDFPHEAIICKQFYCLHYKGFTSIPRCIMALRRIINKERPDLVRSQLYLSSVLARLATPAKVPLVFSIHNPLSKDGYSKNPLALPVEKWTYKKRHHVISVSQDSLDDFDKHVGLKGPSYLLYNFINPLYFQQSAVKKNPDPLQLKLVAVGNLRAQKNYFYLIEAFKQIKDPRVSLDIYGDGDLEEALQRQIDKHKLPIRLKGKADDIFNVLPRYNAYVMCSAYEGFGNAPIEAMAKGLPLLLSDLAVLREVTHGNALFFDPHNPQSFVQLIEEIMDKRHDLEQLSALGMQIAKANYQREQYLPKLHRIYQSVIYSKPQ
jgi:glycosyltransferase involved in cell wall biosynthesis